MTTQENNEAVMDDANFRQDMVINEDDMTGTLRDLVPIYYKYANERDALTAKRDTQEKDLSETKAKTLLDIKSTDDVQVSNKKMTVGELNARVEANNVVVDCGTNLLHTQRQLNTANTRMKTLDLKSRVLKLFVDWRIQHKIMLESVDKTATNLRNA